MGNEFGKLFDSIRDSALYNIHHRNSNAIPAAFQDVIDRKFKEGVRPLIINKHLIGDSLSVPEVKIKNEHLQYAVRNAVTNTLKAKKLMKRELEFLKKYNSKNLPEETWFLVVHLPPSIEYEKDFKILETMFADAVGGTCHIFREGKAVKVYLSNIQLKTNFMFDFTATEFWDFVKKNINNIERKKRYYLPVYLGDSARGPVILDVIDTHILLGGESRWGKTNLIAVIIYCLLLQNYTGRYQTRIAIADLKRVDYPDFDPWVYRIKDLDHLKEFIAKVVMLIEERALYFEQKRVKKIQDYLYKYQANDLPFIFIVLDELHKVKDPETQRNLMKILAMGAGFGVFLIAGTQRPSSTIFEKVTFGDLKANMDLKISVKTATSKDSEIILDSPEASYLPCKGRIIIKREGLIEAQAPYFPLSPEPEDVKQLNKLFGELGPPLFAQKEESVHEYEKWQPQKGVLPRSVHCFPGQEKQSIDCGSDLFTCWF